ncbi:hypothetical protein NUH88_02035 [Nisaea acidiphila]|uniref:Motility protein B-like N-terminal domain-containing protein n=1 Tax=Nisaea acidiphila TaxID=1862145 RepID=A0A9J7ATI0_9PROT|nr:hypothetical protein [Nisaea acidiphila]UUX50478.1 hypothetical protein NUH88_02035 [Nisaea acidiphila]
MVRSDDKARGTSQLGSLPLFLSLFLLLLAFFIFLNSISTRVDGKSNDVLDSVRSSFAAILKGGTGTGVFEGDPGRNEDAGFRNEVFEAFNPLLSVTWLREERQGNPVFVEFEIGELFERRSVDPVLDFRKFAARIAPILTREVGRHNAEVRIWFPYSSSEAGRKLSQLRAARMAEILIGSGAPRPGVSIGFRSMPQADTMRIAVDLGTGGAR